MIQTCLHIDRFARRQRDRLRRYVLAQLGQKSFRAVRVDLFPVEMHEQPPPGSDRLDELETHREPLHRQRMRRSRSWNAVGSYTVVEEAHPIELDAIARAVSAVHRTECRDLGGFREERSAPRTTHPAAACRGGGRRHRVQEALAGGRLASDPVTKGGSCSFLHVVAHPYSLFTSHNI